MSNKKDINDLVETEAFMDVDSSYIEESLLKIVQSFTKRSPRIDRDGAYPAPAAINMENFQITINPRMIVKMVKKAVLESMPKQTKASKIPWFVFDATKTYAMGLILHELSHFLYSPRKAMLEKYLKEMSAQIPPELAFFIVNVIEDAFDQTEIIRDFPSRTYKKCIRYLQEHSQGCSTIEEFAEDLRAGKITKDDVRNKLYYFILRAYNPDHPMVVSKFGRPDIIDWADDTIAAFERVEWIADTEKRCEFTFRVVVPLVWRDLKQNNVSVPTPSTAQSDGTGDEGEGDSAQSDPSQSRNSQERKGGSQDQSSDSAKDGKESGEGSENGKGNGGDAKDQTMEKLRQRVVKAAKELSAAIGENKERTDIDPKKAFRQIDAAAKKDIRKALIDCRESPLSEEIVDKNHAKMSDMAIRLYESCSQHLAKLYNLENYTDTRLHDGDIDESLISEWYTEKNIDIFKQDINLVQNKNISVTFVLDRSGSMDGYRYPYAVDMITALAHAFEDSGIKTSVYVFNSRSAKIKGFDTPLVMEGDFSNLYEKLIYLGARGCTNPSGAFDNIVDTMSEAGDQDTVKLLFFLTDGDMDSGIVERTVQEDVSELTEDGWTVFAIGIDFDDYELKKLGSFTKPAIVKSYSSDSIIDVLGEDIYNTIVDNIIIKS